MKYRMLREQAIRARVERAHAERQRAILAVGPVVFKKHETHIKRGAAEAEDRRAKARAWSTERDQRAKDVAISREQQLVDRQSRFLSLCESKTRRAHDFMKWRDE